MISDVNLISIATIAFLGGFGHCIGMCGGIVIAYTSTKIDGSFSKLKEQFAHLSYNFGRVTTYTFMGLVLGYLGGMVAFSTTTYAILFLIAGLAMILTGLSLVGKVKFLTVIEHSFASMSWYKNSFQFLIRSKSPLSFYLLGVLNGFLPCGFVYFFAITAASTADPIAGATVMFVFGVATIAALMVVANSVSIMNQTKLRDIVMKIAALMVILYGANTLHTSWYFFTDPEASLTNCH